jgi:hypothetical protein
MSTQSIATQSQLGYVNFELTQLLNNLSAHLNADMSEAHGFNLIFGPVNDGSGNNLSYYADASGNVVGNFQSSITIAGVQVYVPANITVLPGEDPSTGTDITPTLDPQTGAGPSNWVTQFEDQFSNQLITILESYLLPHTLIGYWEAHGGIALVNPETTHQGAAGSGSAEGWWSSAAVFVANASLLFNVSGATLRVPCSTRLGGPVQNVVLSGWAGPGDNPIKSPYKVTYMQGGSDTWDFLVHPVIVGGTGPFTYAYDYYDYNLGFTPITANTPVTIFFNHAPPAPEMQVSWNSTTGVFDFSDGAPAENDGSSVVIRVTVSNSTSSAQQNFQFFVQSYS